jgi:hypothetical protein
MGGTRARPSQVRTGEAGADKGRARELSTLQAERGRLDPEQA